MADTLAKTSGWGPLYVSTDDNDRALPISFDPPTIDWDAELKAPLPSVKEKEKTLADYPIILRDGGLEGCGCDFCEAIRRGLDVAEYKRLKDGLPMPNQWPSLQAIPLNAIKTQKARGYRNIAGTGEIAPGVKTPSGYSEDVFLLPQMSEQAKKIWNRGTPGFDYPMFARPCPVTPRHGFVDSRPVSTLEEAEKLYTEEVLPQDSDAELLLVPALSGKFSAVATNMGVTWGLGNDGVTGGGASVSIPTTFAARVNWNEMLSRRAHVPGLMREDIPDVGYVELVEDNGVMRAVQVRNGPEQPATLDFIPRNEFVTRRLDSPVGYNLLEWEQYLTDQITNNGGKPDGLVICTHQMSLASHYAVHAIQLGITFLSTRTAKAGDEMVPIPGAAPRLNHQDLRDLKKLIVKAEGEDFLCDDSSDEHKSCRARYAASTAFGTVHSMTSWDNSPHLMRLRAYSLVTLSRLIMAACAGEMRHWPRRVQSHVKMKTDLPIVLDAIRIAKSWTEDEQCTTEPMIDREDVYTVAIKPMSLGKIAKHLGNMAEDFDARNWGSNSNFGGSNWQAVAQAGHRMTQAIIQFKKAPSAASWKEVVLAANNAIHQVHNGGKVFNKWISDTHMTHAASIPSVTFMNSFAGSIALDILPKAQPIDSASWTGVK